MSIRVCFFFLHFVHNRHYFTHLQHLNGVVGRLHLIYCIVSKRYLHQVFFGLSFEFLEKIEIILADFQSPSTVEQKNP